MKTLRKIMEGTLHRRPPGRSVARRVVERIAPKGIAESETEYLARFTEALKTAYAQDDDE